MTNRSAPIAVGVLLIVSASASAQTKDAVELLPAQTLACIELRQPARLSREVGFLFKGSALDDLQRRLSNQNRNDNPRSYQQRQQLLMLGLFLSPEAIDEAGRIRGGFIALTGLAKDGAPEIVAGLQSGTSNFPGLFMRAFLSSSSAKEVGEVEGVRLYREKRSTYATRPGLEEMVPQEQFSGPVMAQLPGLLLFGSSVDSLKGVIRRAKGKSVEPGLANIRAFRQAAALRERPGLFAYGDIAGLEAALDERLRGEEHPANKPWNAFKTILGEQTARDGIGTLTLQNGLLEGHLRFVLNDKAVSPLLAMLPARPAPRDLLHFAPENALLALAGGLGDGEKRWRTFANLLDALNRLEGRGDLNRPSKAIEAMQEQIGVRIDKDLLAELTGVGLVVHKDAGIKSGQWTLLLRATSEESAAKLEKTTLPRLLAQGREDVMKPVEEEVRGQRISTLRDQAIPPRFPLPLSYGRRGAIVVLGQNQECVLESLLAGGKKAGQNGDAKIAAALKEIDEKATFVGYVSSARVAFEVFRLMSATPQPGVIANVPLGARCVPPQPPADAGQPRSLESLKGYPALRKADELLVFSLNRRPESLVLEMRPLALRAMTPRLLEVWVEHLLEKMQEKGANGGGAFDKLPPPPPPPPAKQE